MKKSLLIGLAVLVLATITGGVVYASELEQIADNVESNLETSFDSVESTFDNIESKFDDDNYSDDDDYDHKGFEMKGEYHSERNAIFEDNQVTQEEIDALTYTKLKEHLLEEFATELEDGVITEEDLIAHKEAKKAEHEAMHAEKDAIFEDNQVTQEEIDALTNTKLKDHLTEEYASELEDGVVSEDELKSGRENHKGKGHKKGRGMRGHDHDDDNDDDHDDDHDDDDYDDDYDDDDDE